MGTKVRWSNAWYALAVVTAGFAVGVTDSLAQSPWTATPLTIGPPGVAESVAQGTAEHRHVGGVLSQGSGLYRPALWTSTSTSWTDLSPANARGGVAYATDGIQQGGLVVFPGASFRSVPSLWTGSAATWVDLTPAQFSTADGVVRGVSNGQQVGAIAGAIPSLWSGTAASWTNLLPKGYESGQAHAVHQGRQVGFVRQEGGGPSRAALWSGSAGSFIDLSPPGSQIASASGIFGNQQVGSADGRAALWSGSAESMVDLTPYAAGAVQGFGKAIYQSFQVGDVVLDGVFPSIRASFWNGSAASWEDLSLALSPGPWTRSEATGVWADSTTIYVTGMAYRQSTGAIQLPSAFLWTRPIPTPGSLAFLGVAGVIAARRRR